jgi:hypothetical protein
MTSPKKLALALAVLVTAVCACMAVAAAVERTTTTLDAVLYSLTAGMLLVGAHVLPAMSGRRPAVWGLSCLCMLTSLYHMAHYFGAAEERAGHGRAAQVRTGGRQLAAVEQELRQIKARPLTDVAADLAKEEGALARASASVDLCKNKCTTEKARLSQIGAKVAALKLELQQAQRAANLAERISSIAATADGAIAAQQADPVDVRLAALIGAQTQTISFVASLVQSALLEVIGIAAWAVALGQPAPVAKSPAVEAQATQNQRVTAASAPRKASTRMPAVVATQAPQKARAVAPLAVGWPALLRRASTSVRNLWGRPATLITAPI